MNSQVFAVALLVLVTAGTSNFVAAQDKPAPVATQPAGKAQTPPATAIPGKGEPKKKTNKSSNLVECEVPTGCGNGCDPCALAK